MSNYKKTYKKMEFISKELFNLLFSHIEEYLKDKSELIIIPDGILALIPFETLIMPDNRYLIEKYDIKYTQSLTVSELITKRKYSSDRKPILAFGGAIYEVDSYEDEIIENERQLAYLKKQTLLAIKEGSSTRSSYNSLGILGWNNLPGTLTEVSNIKRIIDNAEVYTGEFANESIVKNLSQEEKLKEYKIIHFATHGLVVPEIPELTAIVLSQFQQEQKNEDGYLNMKEIVNLDMNADFVNLSACETGLGKIYSGEGIVGLTQSFLIAGANGLSVSLWQVADESTALFMIEIYKLVEKYNLEYSTAISEVKRRFIKGDFRKEYQLPYFWAPFVYYGK